MVRSSNLAITGPEQNWLIGFSKSGLGGQDLILKHPDIFALAASWDLPADMSSYDGLGTDPVFSYGTNANFQANYRLTAAFVKAHSGPFLGQNRIWIGGNRESPTDMSDYAKLLAKVGARPPRRLPSGHDRLVRSGGDGRPPTEGFSALAGRGSGKASRTSGRYPGDRMAMAHHGAVSYTMII
jgi:hypothetical protein